MYSAQQMAVWIHVAFIKHKGHYHSWQYYHGWYSHTFSYLIISSSPRIAWDLWHSHHIFNWKWLALKALKEEVSLGPWSANIQPFLSPKLLPVCCWRDGQKIVAKLPELLWLTICLLILSCYWCWTVRWCTLAIKVVFLFDSCLNLLCSPDPLPWDKQLL